MKKICVILFVEMMPDCLLHGFLSQVNYEMSFPEQGNWVKSIHYSHKYAHLDNVIRAAFKRKKTQNTLSEG